MKLFRASVGLFVAILCILAFLSPSARAEEASKPAAATANDDADTDRAPSIPIPPQPECLAKTGNWSEPEKWAWQQICAREPIDFNKRSGKNVSKDKLSTLKSDPSRKLGATFIRELFENSQLASVMQGAPVNIIGAYIPAVEVSNASVGTLRIDSSYIDDDLSLGSVNIVRSVEVHRSTIDTVRLSLVAGGKVTFHDTSVKTFTASQLNIGRLSFTDAHIDQLAVGISRFSEQLSIMGGGFNEVHLGESKSDGLFVRPTSLRALKINDYVDSSMFFLGVHRWTGDSEIDLSTMTVGRFFLRGDVPGKASILGLSAGSMDWGADPLPYLEQLMAAAPYNPAIYTSLAASYAQAGQSEAANAILIERQNAEFKNTRSWIDKGYLFVIWLLADYGYRPELGLVWIAGFVLLAAVIFESGQSQIVSGKPPTIGWSSPSTPSFPAFSSIGIIRHSSSRGGGSTSCISCAS